MALDVYDDIEACFDGGWSDGLPVVPPYGTLVDRMLGALGWTATQAIGEIPEQRITIRAEHLAAAAVMAGCKVEYAPLLRPLAEALVDPALNLSGCEVTTGGVAILVVVSGPVVGELGFEHEANALGANNRANATVGRFAQLVRLFCGRAGGALQTHGTIGHPGRISYCIAEHLELVWPRFHTQFGISGERSAVTVMAAEGPVSVNNHYAESGEAVLRTIADAIAHFGSTNWYYRFGGYLVAIAPDHMALVGRDFTRDQARRFIYQHAVRSTDELIAVGRIARDHTPDRGVETGSPRSPMASEEQLSFIETGKAGGKFSAVIPRWAAGFHAVSRAL